MPDSDLVLGNITFRNFELPEELDKFGGYQAINVHKFPGGKITTQSMGGFPSDIIRWTGQFFTDEEIGSIESRVNTLTEMKTAGNQITLSFGFYSYSVKIKSFYITPRLLRWQPYQLELVPIQDLNSAALGGGLATAQSLSGVPPLAPSIANNSQGLSPPFAAPSLPTGGKPITAGVGQNSVTTPGQISQLSSANNQLSGQINSTTNYPNLPSTTTGSLTEFQKALNNSIQQALNGQNSINSPQLTGLLEAAQNQVNPLLNSGEPGNQAFAGPTSALLNNIGENLRGSTDIGTTIAVSNPDLNAIAAQYYGDATKWQIIAKANGLLTPRAVGTFNNLIIPKVQNTTVNNSNNNVLGIPGLLSGATGT